MEGRGEVDGLLRPASEGARLATAAGRLLQVSRVEWVVAAQPAQLIQPVVSGRTQRGERVVE